MNTLWFRSFAATALVIVATLVAFGLFSLRTVNITVQRSRDADESRDLSAVAARIVADPAHAAAVIKRASAATGRGYFLAGPDHRLVASAPVNMAGAQMTVQDGAISFTEKAGPGREFRLRNALHVRAGANELYGGPGLAQETASSPNLALVTGVALSVIVSLAATLLLTRSLLRPIGEMTRASRRIAGGDYAQRVTPAGGSELTELATAFNGMAAALERDHALRATLVGDLAHEVRTPLTNLKIRIEALQDGIERLDRTAIDGLHADLESLERLVDDVQELAVVRAAPPQIAPVHAAVVTIVEPPLRALELQAEAKGVHLSADDVARLPTVYADVDRARQVIANLVTNALRHTPAGGSIHLGATATDDAVRFSVSDTGDGIAPDHVPFVFERLYRADPSRARATGGSGLGLAIVKHIIDAHGGEVRVESTPGTGSTFFFTLPRAR